MKKPVSIRRLRQVAIPGMGLVVALDLILAIYHFTHEGTGSGITEFILVVLLSVTAYLILRTPQTSGNLIYFSLSRKIGLTVISLMAGTYLVLGIYHLTHHGLPSGVIELCLTVLMVTIAYLTVQVKAD